MKTSFVTLFLVISVSLFAQEKTSEPIKSALLVIDVQKAFLPMLEEREKSVATYMINNYISVFREKGLPIIRIYHSSEKYGIVPGTPAFDFAEDIAVTTDDIQVIKTHGNAFQETDLEKILHDKGVNTVFLCGLSSVGCVLATWFGAQDLDFKAFLLKNAMMSHDSQYTKQVEIIFDALGYEAVEVMLECEGND